MACDIIAFMILCNFSNKGRCCCDNGYFISCVISRTCMVNAHVPWHDCITVQYPGIDESTLCDDPEHVIFTFIKCMTNRYPSSAPSGLYQNMTSTETQTPWEYMAKSWCNQITWHMSKLVAQFSVTALISTLQVMNVGVTQHRLKAINLRFYISLLKVEELRGSNPPLVVLSNHTVSCQ